MALVWEIIGAILVFGAGVLVLWAIALMIWTVIRFKFSYNE